MNMPNNKRAIKNSAEARQCWLLADFLVFDEACRKALVA
jgi:hypothetical protein